MKIVFAITGLFSLIAATALAQDPAANLDQPGPAPVLAPQDDRGNAINIADNPAGPPTIPHRTRGQQTDLNYNRCMACHDDNAPDPVQAIPIPESHQVDRDGNKDERMSGNRYPCTVCHVPQLRMDR